MALFQIFRGPENGLKEVPYHEGYAYFCEDTGNFFVDVGNNEGDRVQVNAYYATALKSKDGLKEIDIDDLFLNDDVITVTQGGTGKDNLTVNALLIGNGTDPVKMVKIDENAILAGDASNGIKGVAGTGVLYKLAEGAPQFGTLPISLGGTNATTAQAARKNLDVYSKQEADEKVDGATTKAYTVTLEANKWEQMPAGSEEDEIIRYSIEETGETTEEVGEEESGDIHEYNPHKYVYQNADLKCGKNGDVPPIITYTSNQTGYNKIEKAEAVPGEGITFYVDSPVGQDIGIIIIDVQ